jgi:cytochrome c peroxidase
MLCAILMGLGCGDAPLPPEAPAPASETWTEAEITLLESLSVNALQGPPTNPSNRVADDPRAAELGYELFFDRGLSRDGSLSCASCHVPNLLFTDGLAMSRGLSQTNRNAPTVVGAGHSAWQFWDGRRDSLWAQALGPLEASAEMGSTRVAVVRHVASDSRLADRYRGIFGELPPLEDAARFPERAGPFGDRKEQDAWHRMSAADRFAIDTAFANVGKAIEAYERLLDPAPSRFDRWVEGLRGGGTHAADARLDEEEIEGLRLFIDAGRSLCLRCHNGPLLTNHFFHDIGTARGDGRLPDFGRFLGLQAVLMDPFNCLGRYSDAAPRECTELRFIDKRHAEQEMGKFKTPTLRGLPRTAPYMHDGRFATLEEVIEHYRSPPVGPDPLEITPLELEDEEVGALVSFLQSLDGGVNADERWLRPPDRP